MNKQSIKNIKGFTLIEVLVALVVLSLGMLGAAGLQAKSQQFSRNAYLNTQATVISHDMIERMRANTAGLLSGSYDLPGSTQHVECYTSSCNSTQMAENDMYEWNEYVSSSLPGGSGVVCLDSDPDDGTAESVACDGAGDIYALKVWWHDINSEIRRVVTTVGFK